MTEVGSPKPLRGLRIGAHVPVCPPLSSRQAIEHRALQLRHLVGSQYIDAQLDAGRKLQNAYAIRNKNDAAARSIIPPRRFLFTIDCQEVHVGLPVWGAL